MNIVIAHIDLCTLEQLLFSQDNANAQHSSIIM